MADDLDFIREIFRKASVQIDRDDVWSVQASRVVKHKALERLAAALGILYAPPQILRAEKDEAVILVTGSLGDKSEWSIGEACINVNYKVSGKQAAYVYAMAEKRAKDRVILKLAGLHGVYSEDEADDFKQQPEHTAPKQPQSPAMRLDEIGMYVARCKTGIANHTQRDDLIAYWKQEAISRDIYRLNPGVPEYDDLYAAYKAHGVALSQPMKEDAE
jgi:hypothetical protein